MFILLVFLSLPLAAAQPAPKTNTWFTIQRADFGPAIARELTNYGVHLQRVIHESAADENDPVRNFLITVIQRWYPLEQVLENEDACNEWARQVNPAEKDSKVRAAAGDCFCKLFQHRRAIARNTQHFPYDHAQSLLTYHALIAYHFSLMHRAQQYLEEAHPDHNFNGIPRTDAQVYSMMINHEPDEVQAEIRKAYIAFCTPTIYGYQALYPEGTKTSEQIHTELAGCQLWGKEQHNGLTKLVTEYAQPTHFQVHDFRTLVRNRAEIDFVGIDSLKGIQRLSNENGTLQTLGFNHNHLTEIPDEFAETAFPALVNLSFTSNKISNVPAAVVTSCPNLRSLVLSGNPITTLTPEFCAAVAAHQHLEQLIMIRCPLDAASREAITKACGNKVKLSL